MAINNNTLDDYVYQSQIKKYMIQFMTIFSGLKVSVGKNDFNSESNLIEVPIFHGSKDRVVASILASNSPNVPVRLPAMAAHLTRMELHENALKGTDTTYTHTEFPRGGEFPKDLKTVTKLVPTPYKFGAELNIVASNFEQNYQMLEQIFLMFNPSIQFYTSSDQNDWTSINTAFLESIDLEENYPSGSEPRIISTNMQFSFTAYISAPAKIKSDYVGKIKTRFATINKEYTFKDFQLDAESKDINEQYQTIFDIDDYDIPKN